MKDAIGNRMKSNYESRYKFYLTRRTPVIIRIDGKAFHTYTKPFPSIFKNPIVQDAMAYTTQKLVEGIQGAMVGYQQSDEISILLSDYMSLRSEPYFNYEVDKICSITASMATAHFNDYMSKHGSAYTNGRLAMFDSRVANFPKEEVVNYFVWRQQDWTRNSIQMLGREHFSHKQLMNKSNIDVMDMLVNDKQVHWNKLPTWLKRGICVYNNKYIADSKAKAAVSKVIIDKDIPIFKQDRAFIQQFVDYTID